MKLTFHGGAGTVTGSCFGITTAGISILVDCGMRQGRGSTKANSLDFPFDPASIDFIILTHAHLDHSGMLPRAVADGFRGRVITTPATRDLIEPMLFDAAEIQQYDAEWLSRKALRAGHPPVEPLYTAADVSTLLPLIDFKPYDKIFNLGANVRYRFVDAGHILGSSSVELWVKDGGQERKLVFSGDIGKKGTPIIRDPDSPESADIVVMESTYGSRDHRGAEETVDELAGAIKSAFKRGGNVYIPSFAVGRAQDLLYILDRLAREDRLYRACVYLDSPLAEEITRVYMAHPECYDEEARRFFSSGASSSLKLKFVRSTGESMKLNRIRSGCIIIAGSGMCEGGRIVHHFKHNLWRKNNTVIFVGYQAEGTLGRRIVDGAKTVRVLGEEVVVAASIKTIGGFSAHAGRSGLLEWLGGIKGVSKVFIVHGEEESSASFEAAVQERFGVETARPVNGDSFEL